jgi:hypothetical protein
MVPQRCALLFVYNYVVFLVSQCVFIQLFKLLTTNVLQAFWVLVEDVDSEVILHHEYFLLKR